MARLTIPDETTSVSFTVTTPTSAFPISFALLDGKPNLRVSVDDIELLQSGFTFSGVLLDGGGYKGGTVTLNAAATGEVRIWRDVRPQRASNFTPSNSVPVGSVDQALNRLTAQQQDLGQRFDDAVAEAGEGIGLVGKADKTFGNVEADAFSGKTFPVPIGGSGTGIVPSDLQSRFKHYANAVTDFGVSLFEPDGVTLKVNTTEFQTAIDQLQLYNGALFIPPQDGSDGLSQATFYLTGGLQLRDTGTRAGLGVAIEGLGLGERTRGLNGRNYDRGVGLKLADGANAPLITSKPNAGHLKIDNLIFNGNPGAQASPQHGILLEDRTDEAYGFGIMGDHVYLQFFGRSGLFIGAARGLCTMKWLAIEYCGNGSDAALFIGAYDVMLDGVAVGSNVGNGVRIGAAAQVQIVNGAIYLNGGHGLSIAPESLSFQIDNFRIESNSGHGMTTEAYSGADTLLPVRQMSNIFFNDNGKASDNTWDDINVGTGDKALQLVGVAFCGSNGPNKVRHGIYFNDSTGRVQLVGGRSAATSYVTALTNAPGQITT